MVKIEITRSLLEEIKKKFRAESHEIIDLIESLEDNPNKGKIVGQVNGIVIKEVRYKSYRFYFITDGYKLKLLEKGELIGILIKFVRMSDKKDQQKIIDEIKHILRVFGEQKFE
ncbi:hypothetical protein J4466_02760 [Candidatus Pacearchaeota archaeon]|nr:hypothetical protein [Candidatus Pacearchaeota archaeon]